MNLLPKSHDEFSQKEYWNEFFKKRGSRAFEWYGEYPELCGILHKYIKPKDVILTVGCGNSTLSADLYDVGYRQITNIDISHVAIKQMQASHGKDRPEMVYQQMDALDMTFEDGQFSVVLDKGTLDALMPDGSDGSRARVERLFKEVDRVLRVGGRYVCVSLLQEHILSALLSYFPAAGWMFRVCRCPEAGQKAGAAGLVVFVVVCTKFKKLANMQPLLEACLHGEQIQRLDSVEDIQTAVKSFQQTTMICERLNRGSVANHGEVSLDLFRPGEDTARFTVYVLDQPFAKGIGRRFAAFIIPQGRETEWLFSTQEGRITLMKSAGYDRLAIVALHRDHTYDGLEGIQQELSECVTHLAPPGLPKNFKVLFLSIGSDVGHRDVCYRGCSPLSGPFVVEEVERDGQHLYRRLVFLDNQNLVQSEARLKLLKSRKGKPHKVVDVGHLACEHHTYMTVGVSLVAPEGAECNVAVIGLGGGGLCTFLQHCFPKIRVTAVDIDPTMLEVARDYFDLVQDERLAVYIRDGITFLQQAADQGSQFHAILFDVDSKTPGDGMSCPPAQFLEPPVLQAVRTCLGEQGLFVVNLVCRSSDCRKDAMGRLRKVFPSICSYKLDQEVNEVVFCRTSTSEPWAEKVRQAAERVNNLATKRKLMSDNLVDVAALITSLQLT